MFFHVDIFHFGVNMMILLIFGLLLEKSIGSIKFLAIYVCSGLIGNLVQSLLISDSFVLGASAALFGLIGAILMREPLLKIRILGIIPSPIILVFGLFFVISSVINSMVFASNSISGDIAHMTGFFVGVLLAGLFFQSTIRVFYNWLGVFFGFWIIKLSIENMLYGLGLVDILYFLALILVGAILVYYSYTSLKKLNLGAHR